MSIALLALTSAAVVRGGAALAGKGILAGGTMLYQIIPILLLAFIIAGLISELIHDKLIYRWLGKEAGWKGPVLGALAGALVPGGPFFFYPLLAALVSSSAAAGTIMSFITAKTLWSVGRIPLEIALVGTRLTVIRLVITFVFPIIAGILVNTFLPDYTDKIRKDVERLQLKKNAGGKQ